MADFENDRNRKRFCYLSFGAGVQSTALLIMSTLRLYDCPQADVAIFADTQDEPFWVYENVERMKTCAENRLEVVTITLGRLSQDLKEKKFVTSIPAYTAGSDGRRGMLLQQCTRKYKIDLMHSCVKRILGYRKGQWVRHKVTTLIGISTDEAHRMAASRDIWVEHKYPLIDAGLNRRDCKKIIADADLPVPKKSACVHCPYHSDSYWRDLKDNYPDEFLKAVETDRNIRNITRKGAAAPVFLHASLKPLEEIDFKSQGELDLGFGNDCLGVCGV